MPFQPSSFYDPMYWRSNKRDLSNDAEESQIDTENNGTDVVKNVTKRYAIDYDDTLDRTKYHSELNNQLDISAGELYKSLETMLVE